MDYQNIVKKQFYKNKLSWINSSREGFSLDHNNNPMPWYTYNAIDFLNDNLNKNDIVFEFGCGASTIYYLNKVKKVISLETNKIWFQIIFDYLTKTNCNPVIDKNIMRFKESEIYLMTDGLTNNNYQKFASNYSQQKEIYFDYIVVDSIKRYECAINSINSLKQKGIIILDDSERSNYKKIFDFYEKNDFIINHFYGIAPSQLRLKNTSLITKLND